MAVTRLEISVAARSAGHLFVTTTVMTVVVVGPSVAVLASNPPSLTVLAVDVGLMALMIGLLSALYYARRNLNVWLISLEHCARPR